MMDYNASSPVGESGLASWLPVAAPSPLQLGRVVCISGSQVIAVLDQSICGADKPHELRKGALVKMVSDDRAVFGMVTGLSIPAPAGDAGLEVYLGELDLVGEVMLEPGAEFRRGVTANPALGEALFAASEDDLAIVYKGRGAVLTVGKVYQTGDRPAVLSTDGLLGKHFAILGTTGAGKSCAVAMLLHQVLAQNPEAHVLMLDPHGEYAAAFPDSAEVLSPANLELPYWLFNAEEISEVVAGGRRDGEFVAEGLQLLKDLIPVARRSYFRASNPQASDSYITVDTPVPYAMRELVRLIDEQMGRLDKSAPLGPFRWLKGRLDALKSDNRFAFMFGGVSVRDTMAEVLARLFRIPVNGKPITIVDISGVPSEVLNVVVSVLSRMTFDFALWSRGAVPVLLVCEEAHRYVPAAEGQGFEPTKDALARIAKEGRKYGVSLAIISQRPAEIAPSILSQCNTTIAFRITSVRDQELVRGVVTDSANGLLDFLPSLGNGEAIVAGEAVSVPQRIRFDLLPPDRRPRSATASFASAWQAGQGGQGLVLAEVVERWRRQAR
jgi:uncharacterized protein